MLVFTADRPPELRGVGAPQTIDQIELYGRSVRWFRDAAVPDEPIPRHGGRSPSERPRRRRRARPPQPAVPRPLLGAVGEVPEPRRTAVAVPRASPSTIPSPSRQTAWRDRRRWPDGVDPTAIDALADAAGWPVLADPQSGCRARATGGVDVRCAARDTATSPTTHAPESSSYRPPPGVEGAVAVDRGDGRAGSAGRRPRSREPGPQRGAASVASTISRRLRGADGHAMAGAVAHAEQRADRRSVSYLDAQRSTEPGVARVLADALADDDNSSSLRRCRCEISSGSGRARACTSHANRAPTGSTASMSTALAAGARRSCRRSCGSATSPSSTTRTRCVAVHARASICAIVVADNGGGGIFSFLPQATRAATRRGSSSCSARRTAPTSRRWRPLTTSHRQPSSGAGELAKRSLSPGPSLTRIVTDRVENVRVHAELNLAVAASLR